MADHEWLRHLARSRFDQQGEWQPEDPEAVKRLAASRLDDTITSLYEEAFEAVEVFNGHAKGRRAIRLLPVAGSIAGTQAGFMFLLGHCQLSLVYTPHQLEATLTTLKGFERITKKLYCFAPHVDRFGSLVWSMDMSLLMTNELIIKRLMEDLARAAFENGDA